MFYFLQKANNVGVVPQIRDLFRGEDPEKFWRANRNFDPILNYTIPVPTLFLEKGAKITDSLTSANFLYPFETANEKLLKYIQGVRADELRIMPTTAIKKDVSYPYWFVAIDIIHDEYVDYPKCRFVLNEMLSDIEEINIPNAESFYEKKQSLPPSITILARRLILKESIIQHDYVYSGSFDPLVPIWSDPHVPDLCPPTCW